MSKIMDSKGDENFPLNQMTKNDEKNSSKKSLTKDILKEPDPATEKLVKEENEKQQKKSIKERLASSRYLSNRRVRGVVITLLALLIIVGLTIVYLILNMTPADDWKGDPVQRMMRTIPMPNGSRNLIRFRRGEPGQSDRQRSNIVSQMEKFVGKYNFNDLVAQQKNVTMCSESKQPSDQEFCFYPIDRVLENCKPKDQFGYSGTPCVFIVLNKILNWLPEAYTQEDMKSNSSELSPEARSRINPGSSKVLITCGGRHNFDKENIGKISYYPSQEIDAYFFNYDGHEDFLEPFIAIKFESLTSHAAIGVECRIWSRNLNSTSIPSPSLPFNILME
ncbi:sodium/potassium-transporting ATPase subunit beta-1-like [Brevipalpus obovatus]|uniref:sodium/potassium-transporting ATPase subunit beta-1-like n=1 Tax=Brevipalpus obovatus TaxID=246614 RepID=UPI003D9EC6AE